MSFQRLCSKAARLAAITKTKRRLTPVEVDSICDQIPINVSIPFETAVLVRNGLVDSIKGQLEEIELYEEGIPELKKTVVEEYYRSLLQPGEMVGVQAATSIGEPVTQMSLNAFHYSGISTIGIASGVPRVEEILNASKKQKSCIMKLYFKEKMNIRQVRKHSFKNITEVNLGMLLDNVSVGYHANMDSVDKKTKEWYQLYMDLYEPELVDDNNNFIYNWFVRLELNRNKLYQHSTSTIDIAKKIEASFRDLYVIAAPNNIGFIDVYIDFNSIELKKKEEAELATVDICKEFKCILNVMIPYLKEIQISGIQGIEDVNIQKEGQEWMAITKGSNLYAAFNDDQLDFTRCRSSDIWEIYRVFGVEATRRFIIEEFYSVLATSGASVGRRHIELLADSMTFQGKINSVNRYGIDRNQIGPLAKASFEESVRNFLIAAVNGEKDTMGVSASLMGGKLVKCGTGYCDVVLNEEMLKKAKVPKDEFVYQTRPDSLPGPKVEAENRGVPRQAQRSIAEIPPIKQMAIPSKPEESYKPYTELKPQPVTYSVCPPINGYKPAIVERNPDAPVYKPTLVDYSLDYKSNGNEYKSGNDFKSGGYLPASDYKSSGNTAAYNPTEYKPSSVPAYAPTEYKPSSVPAYTPSSIPAYTPSSIPAYKPSESIDKPLERTLPNQMSQIVSKSVYGTMSLPGIRPCGIVEKNMDKPVAQGKPVVKQSFMKKLKPVAQLKKDEPKEIKVDFEEDDE
jgi:DNA-directed RNA polymerase II subunit RPB1